MKRFIGGKTEEVTKEMVYNFLKKARMRSRSNIELLPNGDSFTVLLSEVDVKYLEALITIIESGLTVEIPEIEKEIDPIFGSEISKKFHYRYSTLK